MHAGRETERQRDEVTQTGSTRARERREISSPNGLRGLRDSAAGQADLERQPQTPDLRSRARVCGGDPRPPPAPSPEEGAVEQQEGVVGKGDVAGSAVAGRFSGLSMDGGVAPPPVSAGGGSRYIAEGWLHKRSSNHHLHKDKFVKRWFMIENTVAGPALSYCPSPEDRTLSKDPLVSARLRAAPPGDSFPPPLLFSAVVSHGFVKLLLEALSHFSAP